MVIFNAKFGSEYVIRIVFKLIRLVGYSLNIKSNCFNIKSKGIVLARFMGFVTIQNCMLATTNYFC